MLTAKEADALKPRAQQYEVADGKVQGLALRVLPSGAKRWAFRYRTPTGWRRIAIGGYPDLGIADARAVALDHLRGVRRDGRDPSAEKREARAEVVETYRTLAETYIRLYAKANKRRTWKVDQRLLLSGADVPKSWHRRPVREITKRDVRDLLEAKAQTAPIQANRLRAALFTLFAWAVERDAVEHNVVADVKRPSGENTRQRVLSADEVRAFWRDTEAMPLAMRNLWRFLLVTGQRRGEGMALRWADLDGAVWTVPAEIAKNGLSHRVPLSSLALDLLAELPRKPKAVYVFAGARGNRQFYEAAKLVGLDDFRAHDLRRTAASGMAEAGVSKDSIAKVLNHAPAGVTEQHYIRHTYDAEKRIALDTWAARLAAILGTGEGGAVLPFWRRA